MSDVFHGLPRRLKIGHYTFRVKIQEAVATEDTECWGLADMQSQTISLVQGMGIERALNTVQHEITHCINNVYGVVDESDEETFTTQQTNGQIAFWLDNPKAFTWLAKTLRAVRALQNSKEVE
jgi:hypothetical protein